MAQNLDSNFGKIVSIDKSTNQSNIFSSGHRNPQGLYYDSKLEIILSTEHGPKGGDELNIIEEKIIIMDGQYHLMENIMMEHTKKKLLYINHIKIMVLQSQFTILLHLLVFLK